MLTLCLAGDFLLPDINLQNPVVKVFIPAAGIFITVLFCKYKYQYSLTTDLRLLNPRFHQLLFLLFIALIWMLGTDYFMNWRGPFDFTSWYTQPLYVSISRILAVCFFGPVLEELIFRGLLFHKIADVLKMNKWLTIIILAATWSALHYTYSIPVIVVIFIEGLLLGTAVVKSGSLIIPIAMHICWNLYAVW